LKFTFETLNREFDRDSFDCGIESLNDFLKRYALQNLKKNISVSTVAMAEKNPKRILGYYSVSIAQVSFEHLPPDVATGIPRYPVPALRIGRLAVDRSAQGAGLGGSLLRHALLKALDLSRQVGTCVVLVDAIDESAKQFYIKFGFVPLLDLPLSLVLQIDTISKAYRMSK
jgi:GNAT superfamily N-acetyltransferase